MTRIVVFLSAVLSGWTGSISGIAVDITGAVIPHSKIVAISERGEQKEATSDQEGYFKIYLEPGTYSLEVSSLGFRNRKIEGLLITDENEIRLPDTELSVAAVGGCEGPISAVGLFTPMNSKAWELSGRTLPSAVVSVERAGNRKLGSARADAHGAFSVTGLGPGKYEVRVRHAGYALLIVEGVEIRKGFRSEAMSFDLTPCKRGSACPAVKWTPPSMISM